MQRQTQFLVLSRSCQGAQPFTIQFDPPDVAAPRRETELVRQQASRTKFVGDATYDPVNFLAVLPNVRTRIQSCFGSVDVTSCPKPFWAKVLMF